MPAEVADSPVEQPVAHELAEICELLLSELQRIAQQWVDTGCKHVRCRTDEEIAGDPIEKILTTAPGNGAPIGGLKVVTAQGWFAARPSGTEQVYKLYAESFRGSDHLRRIQQEAQPLLDRVLAGVAR